jgi:ABC-type dipeptide/oligopeptide/nickel transport system ATPase subunit
MAWLVRRSGLRKSRIQKYRAAAPSPAWGALILMGAMKKNVKSALSRWTCVRLHFQSRISSRHPLRSISFHLAGILRELTPTRGGY